MTTGETILLSLGFCAILMLSVRILLGLWQARGTRIVQCPENHQTVAVEVDPWTAVKDTLGGPLSWELCDCTRWPEKDGCGQMCISQIESAPGECLLRNILTSWYAGKKCLECGKEFREIHWHDHQPALLDSRGKHHEWSEFAPEKVPAVLQTHYPLCWDCLVARDFRQRFPELVTERDFPATDTPGIWKHFEETGSES